MEYTAIEKALKDVTLDESNRIAKKAVNAAAPIMRDSLKRTVPKKTGDLSESIVINGPATENLYGVFTSVGASGVDRNGVPNDLKLQVLEYGRAKAGAYHNKNGAYVSQQKSRPVRYKAMKAVEEEIVSTMEQVVYDELERILGE